MKHIHPYLTFSGNCREAMTFYQKCLGGTLNFQTIGESPLAEKLPDELKKYILQATLKSKYFVLLGSDIVSEEGLVTGNSVSLSLHCSSENELMEVYRKLSIDGKVEQEVEPTSWGALFGQLTDKYGHHWLINYIKK